jgi:hypothetical protein
MTKIKVDLKEERKTTEVVLQRLMSLANPLDIEYIFPKLAHIVASEVSTTSLRTAVFTLFFALISFSFLLAFASYQLLTHVLTNYAASSTRGPFIDTCNSPESMLYDKN